jgi:uncharacterized glyoxalase superfamily protein PhnB
MSRIFRVVVPTGDIEQSCDFYAHLLETDGERVSPDRHYFHCGSVILVCVDRSSDGDACPNPEPIDFAVDDLDAMYARAQSAGCSALEAKIETRPWGERSFWAKDPFGNPLYFVDAATCFLGFGAPEGGDLA